jgi:hypothetical protein
MKRHRNPHGSRSRDLASSARGEMRLALGVLAVFVEKHGLDEQQIGAAQETRKSLPVAWVVGHIRDIADLLSGYEFENLGLQLTERNHLVVGAVSRAPMDSNRRIVGRAGAHLFLEVSEPRARR